MIARLTGVVAEKTDDHAIIDVNGVGYRVQLSSVALAALPPRGEKATLRIHTHVREDALTLYGFASDEEEAVFHGLIGVKNVGPRAAQNILSGIEARDLASAIVQSDIAKLTKLQGVGKKTAERLVLELKEKLAAMVRSAVGPNSKPAGGLLEQLAQALVGLGYKPQQAEKAVDALRESAEGRKLDELLREALKLMRG